MTWPDKHAVWYHIIPYIEVLPLQPPPPHYNFNLSIFSLPKRKFEHSRKFENWRENGEIRTFSKIRKMAGKRRNSNILENSKNGGKTAVHLNCLLAGLSKIVSLNGSMTARNWRRLWTFSGRWLSANDSHAVCLCCKPLENCRWQRINEQILGTRMSHFFPHLY